MVYTYRYNISPEIPMFQDRPGVSMVRLVCTALLDLRPAEYERFVRELH